MERLLSSLDHPAFEGWERDTISDFAVDKWDKMWIMTRHQVFVIDKGVKVALVHGNRMFGSETKLLSIRQANRGATLYLYYQIFSSRELSSYKDVPSQLMSRPHGLFGQSETSSILSISEEGGVMYAYLAFDVYATHTLKRLATHVLPLERAQLRVLSFEGEFRDFNTYTTHHWANPCAQIAASPPHDVFFILNPNTNTIEARSLRAASPHLYDKHRPSSTITAFDFDIGTSTLVIALGFGNFPPTPIFSVLSLDAEMSISFEGDKFSKG